MSIAFAPERQFIADLYAGPFRGHGIIMDPPFEPAPFPGDVSCSDLPVRDWLPQAVRNFEIAREWHEMLGDDAVPFGRIQTGTETFASAFGCQVHLFAGSMPAARPLITTAAEAERLQQPTVGAQALERILEFAVLLSQELGPEIAVGGMDYQSAFDVAALVWRKQDLYMALYGGPEAVKGLVSKCQVLLDEFTREFLRVVPNPNLCHCPIGWGPPELGFWLSEDEAGAMSVPMFEEFCLPSLVELSEAYGGMLMHCCAHAEHQYPSFLKIPNLRVLNRPTNLTGPPTIKAFAGKAVLLLAWNTEEQVVEILKIAEPESRFMFWVPAAGPDEAKERYGRLRELCPRCRQPQG